MTNSIPHSDSTMEPVTMEPVSVFLSFAIVFDVFQFLVIITSLCGGLVLLLVLPIIKRRNFCTLWLLILFGFLHEFYSVILLMALKSKIQPAIHCVDIRIMSMLVTSYILCTILTSALKNLTKSGFLRIFVWIYVLCITSYLSSRKFTENSNQDLKVDIQPTFHLRLTSCGTNLPIPYYLFYEYLLIYIPMVITFILIRKFQPSTDFRFWNVPFLSDYSPSGMCSRCSKENKTIQITLVYLSATVFIIRPLMVAYHLVFGGSYYEIVTSIVVMGTYCFLCIETFIGLGRCKAGYLFSEKFTL